ncbi:23S rRNA (pseudouridine(1915)-N(3))-methyltransferase RlmH [Candidatus Leptofilum sp.]|uniref:23S rRNA (pseudouridine(1915)-N(3))-methyltransferase RlmH n=1 Tax=Candidatus Leptofilum sp. TaxID=3241576 RepID=UPI003B5AF85E
MRLNGRLTIAAVGKIKSRAWLAAQDDYVKRLRRYTTLDLIEVKDVVGRRIPDDVAMAKEGEQLLRATSDSHRLIALTPTGKMQTSPNLAKWLQKRVEGYGRIAFLIGGPLGFSDDVLAACHEQISLSPLTFTHEMARILLLEQLYRACTILAGEQYHK